MDPAAWWLYLPVVLLSTLSPGPAVLLSMSNAVARGLRASALSSLGNVAGLVVLSAASLAGAGAVLRSSAGLFTALKVAGAACLVYLGIRQWRSAGAPVADDAPRAGAGARTLFLQGFAVALTNPKALLFFAALFPPFLRPDRPLGPQVAALMGTLVSCSFAALMGYAFVASRARGAIGGGAGFRVFRRVAGAAFVGLGLALLARQGAPG